LFIILAPHVTYHENGDDWTGQWDGLMGEMGIIRHTWERGEKHQAALE
jgi:hypothetical protein